MRAPTLRVLFMTGYTNTRVRSSFLDKGMTHHRRSISMCL